MSGVWGVVTLTDGQLFAGLVEEIYFMQAPGLRVTVPKGEKYEEYSVSIVGAVVRTVVYLGEAIVRTAALALEKKAAGEG